MADTLIFLKICNDETGKGDPLIKGESNAAGFEDQIEIEAVEWRFGLPGYPAGGERAQLEFKELTLEKHIDASTCTLLDWAKTKKRANKPKDEIKRMTITYVDMVVAADGKSSAVPVVEFMVYGCYLQNIDLNVSDSGKSVALKETLEVSYQKIDVVYHPLGADRRQRGGALTFRGLVPGKV